MGSNASCQMRPTTQLCTHLPTLRRTSSFVGADSRCFSTPTSSRWASARRFGASRLSAATSQPRIWGLSSLRMRSSTRFGFIAGSGGPQKIVGSAFKRVALRGRIHGSVRFVPSIDWSLHRALEAAVDDPFVRANQRYYDDVDWALDISAAEFTGIEMSLCDIPARLIRRDPQTQVVVTRESAARGDWRRSEGSSQWVAIERFLQAGFGDTVLVAPTRSKYVEADVAAFRRLATSASH